MRWSKFGWSPAPGVLSGLPLWKTARQLVFDMAPPEFISVSLGVDQTWAEAGPTLARFGAHVGRHRRFWGELNRNCPDFD